MQHAPNIKGHPLRHLPPQDRLEAAHGREHWTVADYREAGRREFDTDTKRNPKRTAEQVARDREHYASCYVLFHCPQSKLDALAADTRRAVEAAASRKDAA